MLKELQNMIMPHETENKNKGWILKKKKGNSEDEK